MNDYASLIEVETFVNHVIGLYYFVIESNTPVDEIEDRPPECLNKTFSDAVFNCNDLDYTPEMLHAEYCKIQTEKGFVFSKFYNEGLKTDPNLCEFEKLGNVYKTKFVLIHTICNLLKPLYVFENINLFEGLKNSDVAQKGTILD